MATRRSQVDWKVVAVYSALVAFVVAFIVGIVKGYGFNMLGVWIFLGALWLIQNAFDRGCWRGVAQLIGGAFGLLCGGILIGGGWS